MFEKRCQMSHAPENKHPFERWLIPALIIAFCLAAIWLSLGFKKMPPILKRGMQPSDFPQVILVGLILLTVAMAIFDPVKIRDRLEPTTLGTLALFAVFAVLTSVDFFLALAVFASALTALWGERRPIVLALVGLIVPVFIFFLFDQVFEIRFPRGLITNLWYG